MGTAYPEPLDPLARLLRAASAHDLESVWALAAALRRAGSPWGEALRAACPPQGAASWEAARDALADLTPCAWDDALADLTRALLDRAEVTRDPLPGWLVMAARGVPCPPLRLVTSIRLGRFSGWVDPSLVAAAGEGAWERLFQCPDLAGARCLSIHLHVTPHGLWQALAQSRWLAEVEALDVYAPFHGGMDDADGAALCALPWRRLRSLSLAQHQLARATVQALRANPALGTLRDLSLRAAPLDEADTLSLLSAPCCRAVARLTLPTVSAEALSLYLSRVGAAPISDHALRYALSQLDPDHTPVGALHPSIPDRLVGWLDDLITDATSREHAPHHAAARLLNHTCRSAQGTLRAHLAALSSDAARALARRLLSPPAVTGAAAWSLYAIWSLIPLPARDRAEDLLAALRGPQGHHLPNGYHPCIPTSARSLTIPLLQDLCALDLRDAPDLAADRRARAHAVSKGNLQNPITAEAISLILTLDPSCREPVIDRLRDHLRAYQGDATAVIDLSRRLDLPPDALRPIALSALSARSANLRTWGFTTLASFDTYDPITRAALLHALTCPNSAEAAPLLYALRDGWMPRCVEALHHDHVRPDDTAQHPSLRPLQGTPLITALYCR